MSSKFRRDPTFVAVSWLKKLMTGEQSCEWSSWFRAHWQGFDEVPSTFDFVNWNMDHTRLLREVRLEYEKTSSEVYVEQQNKINYRTDEGTTVLGTPDVVATAPGSGDVVIADAKTGKPHTSDQAQVLIYMYLLPKANPYYMGRKISGVVVYRDHRVEIPASGVTTKFIENFDFWISILSSDEEPHKAPSTFECRFCPIAQSECPERSEKADDVTEEQAEDGAKEGELPF